MSKRSGAEIDREDDPRRSSRRSVSVKLGGKEYRLRSDADPEWLQQVASYLDKSMQTIRERTNTVDSLDIALLAALNLAREVLQLREGATDAPVDGIDPDRLRGLIELVETELRGDAVSGSS
jgi:cell division protein ZapA